LRQAGARLFAGCGLAAFALAAPRSVGPQVLGLTGDWRLSGAVRLSGCLDVRLDGTRPASLLAAGGQVRDRFVVNGLLVHATDRFSLDLAGTVSDGAFTGTVSGVRRGPGALRGSVSGSLAGNALTATLSAEIVGLGCLLEATLGGVLTPGDPETFRLPIDVAQVLPQARLRPGVRVLAINNLLPSARTAGEELAEALDRIFGVSGARVSQNPSTGVASSVLPGRRFAFLPVGLVPSRALGPAARQQTMPSLASDVTTGTTTVTTASGAQLTVVPAPFDLEAFLALAAPLAVTGVEIAGSQYLFTTAGTVQFSAGFEFDIGSGGTTAGLVGQPDGTALSTYATGETQRINPLVVDRALFAQAAAETLGASGVTQDLAGVISFVRAGRATRLRPDFTVGPSPAGAGRALVEESASAFVLDTGDGRRQRFFVTP
jgi:hypothetical protein